MSEPKRRLRTWLWRIAVVAALTSALVTGLAIGIREGFARETLRAWIEQLGSEALGLELRIGALEGRLLPELRLRDVELRRDSLAATPLLRAQAIDLRVDLDPLLEGQPLGIIALVVRGMELHAIRNEQGLWNFQPRTSPDEEEVVAATANSESPGGPALRIERLLLEEATLFVEDGPRSLRVGIGAALGPLILPFGPAEATALDGTVHATLDGQPPILLKLSEGRAHVPPVVFEFARGSVSVEGEADLAAWLASDGDADARLELQAREVDPAALPTRGWQEGSVSGALSAGFRREQGVLGSDVTLDLAASRIEGFALERAHLRGSTRGEHWQLVDLEIVGSPLHATARGRGVGRAIERLDSEIAVADLAPLAELVGAEAVGSITVTTNARGSVTAPDIRLTAEGRDLALSGVALGTLSLEAHAPSPVRWILSSFALSEGDVTARLEAPAQLELEGEDLELRRVALTSNVAESVKFEGALRGGLLADVQATASGIEPQLLARLAGQDIAIAGTAALALELAGPPERPVGSMRIDWQQPHFADVGFGFDALRGEWTAREEQIAWALRGTDPDSELPLLELEGHAPWSSAIALASLPEHPETSGSLRMQDLALQRLGPLVPEALRSATGQLTLDVRARGSETGPQLEGRLALSNGSFPVSVARQRFEPIDMELELAGSRVAVRSFTVGAPGEQLRITGSLGLEGMALSDSNLTATLESFQLSRSSLLRTKASGTMSLTGPIRGLRLQGDLALEEVRVLLPEEQDRELREIEVFAASSSDIDRDEFVERDELPDAFDLASARVAIRIPAGSRVRGRGAELDLAGDLELHKKPLDAIRLTGEASVVRGSFQFQRKRFNLERGVVHFDGGADPSDPVIDFVGVHRVRAVSVILRATGRLSDPPLVELTGDPPMSPDEALSYLVFGRPLDELRDSERGSVQSAAASIAASMAVDELARLISKTGIIDTIEIDITEDGSLETLRFGTYIGNKTYVRAGNTFGADSEQEVQVEYRLTPRLSVESQLSTTGNAGADLILRLEY